MRLFLFLSFSLLLSSCFKPQVSWLSSYGLNFGDNQKVNEKPKPGDEDYVRYVWEYLETRNEKEDMNDTAICEDGFALDEDCPQLNLRCHRNFNVYRCQPEDQTLIYKGQVVDENGHGVPNVYVQFGLPFGGYTDMAHVYSKDDGRFILKSSGTCFSMAWAHKEGYAAPWGYDYTSSFTQCDFIKWGSDFIKLQLFKKK